jgi:hypothetical protein
MDRHICKQCGKPFNYCRACVLKPTPWKAAGFCSKECSAAYKSAQKIEEVVPVEDVEVVVKDDKDTTISENE